MLCGYKTVRDDRGFDFWTDTSCLDVTLYRVDGDSPTAVARGVLRISVLGFLTLFLSMRVGREPAEDDSVKPQRGRWRHALSRTRLAVSSAARWAVRQISVRIRFNAWFLWQLARFYGNPFAVHAAALQIRGDRTGAQVRRDLDFEPQGRVRWADPRVLVRTALNLRRATDLGDMIDVRQLRHASAQPYRELARRQRPVDRLHRRHGRRVRSNVLGGLHRGERDAGV